MSRQIDVVFAMAASKFDSTSNTVMNYSEPRHTVLGLDAHLVSEHWVINGMKKSISLVDRITTKAQDMTVDVKVTINGTRPTVVGGDY